MYKRIAIGLAALCALAVSSSARASIALTPDHGSTTKITYTNGATDYGLFGSPTLSGAAILFSSPSNFRATAANGAASPTVSDRVSFVLTKTDGSDLDRVAVSETGDWSILGTGLAKVTGGLFLYSHDAATFGTVYSTTPTVTYKNVENGTTIVSPTIPTNSSSGTWLAELSVTLPAGLKSVELVLNNNLQVTAGAVSTSLIQKKGINIVVRRVTAPEPATMAFVFAGGTLVLGRRRRPERSVDDAQRQFTTSQPPGRRNASPRRRFFSNRPDFSADTAGRMCTLDGGGSRCRMNKRYAVRRVPTRHRRRTAVLVAG